MRPSREEVQEWPESRFQRYDAPDKVRRARGEHGEVVVDAVAVAVLRQVAGVAVIERGAAQALRKLVAAAGDACRLDQHLARRLAHPERAGHADRAVDCREPFCLQPRHRAHADRDIAQCRLRRHPTHRRSRRLDLQSRTCSNAPSFHADARVGTIAWLDVGRRSPSQLPTHNSEEAFFARRGEQRERSTVQCRKAKGGCARPNEPLV